jgi:hypothetical protein
VALEALTALTSLLVEGADLTVHESGAVVASAKQDFLLGQCASVSFLFFPIELSFLFDFVIREICARLDVTLPEIKRVVAWPKMQLMLIVAMIATHR